MSVWVNIRKSINILYYIHRLILKMYMIISITAKMSWAKMSPHILTIRTTTNLNFIIRIKGVLSKA